MKIEKYKEMRIKGNSKYFKDKYGTSNPIIIIEDLWKVVSGISWMFSDDNPACLIYAMRSGFEGLPIDDNVYYGKVGNLGELVHESELEDEK